MSFWSVVAPVAGIGAGIATGNPMIGMGVGSAVGGLAANERRNEMLDRQRQTALAAADAQRVSWARPSGKNYIPQVQYAEGTSSGDLFGGATAGAIQGYQAGLFGQQQNPSTGFDWVKAKNDAGWGEGDLDQYGLSGRGGRLGMK